MCVSMSETDINDNDKPQRRQSEWYHMSVMETKITGNSTAFVASLCKLKTKKPSNIHTTGLCGWIPLTKGNSPCYHCKWWKWILGECCQHYWHSVWIKHWPGQAASSLQWVTDKFFYCRAFKMIWQPNIEMKLKLPVSIHMAYQWYTELY